MDIREATPDEYPLVADLSVAAYRTLGDPAVEGYTGELGDVVARASAAAVIVAVENRQPLGAVTYVPGPSSSYAEFDDPDAAGIRMLAVHPCARGRGIGAALIDACVRRARDDGRTRMILHTTAHMHAARRIYGRYGFARAPDRDFEPVPGVTLLGYVYELR